MIRTILAATALCLSAPVLAKTIDVAPGEGAQERLQEALILAEPGDVVMLGEGRFDLTDGLSLDVDKVTLRGAGMDKSVLSFAGQLGAGEGLLVTSDDVTLRDFAVENTKGDGIKSKGADQIIYHSLRVEWTGGPKATNGAYGIYPVESKNVLVQDSYVRGASDAGIYVGQSDNIIVRRNKAVQNVAGIEIENSFNAEVTENLVTENTGGILVFDLPNLPQMGGHNVLVARNAVIGNNTDNFAPEGNIVASVPAGTGVMVMANRRIDVMHNALINNGTASIMVISYSQEFDDPDYDPTPRDVVISENIYGRTGFAPDFPGGKQLAGAFGGALPPIVYDGTGPGLYIDERSHIKALTLGLTKAGQDITSGTPAMYERPSGWSFNERPQVVMPAGMEARLK